MELKKRKEVKKEIFKEAISESEPEQLLFEKLTQKGYRPEKQFKACGYFLDLSYPDLKIAIEYDGKHHQNTGEYDIRRQKHLEEKDWKVFRIANIGLHKGVFKITNCWGTELGIFMNMEDSMDAMVKEVVWFLKRYGYNKKQRVGFKHISEYLEDAFNRIDKKCRKVI